MSNMRKIGRTVESCIVSVNRFVQYIGMAAVIAMMFLTVVHAVGRYAFEEPVPGVIELSGYLLVTAVFLLIGNAMVENRHITIGIIVDRLPLRIQAIVDVLTMLIGLVFSLATSWETFVQGAYIMKMGQASEILHIPNYPFYFLVGIGWALFSLALLLRLFYAIRRAVNK